MDSPDSQTQRVHLVVQAQRQPERVEARAQVSASGGHPNPHDVVSPGHFDSSLLGSRRNDVTSMRF